MCVDPNLKIFMGMHTRGDQFARTDGEDQDAGAQVRTQGDRKTLYSPSPAPMLNLDNPDTQPQLNKDKIALSDSKQADELV